MSSPDPKKVRNLSAQLKNVGPKLAARMLEAGIESPDKLRELGAVRAYQRMYPEGDRYGDFNTAYLYALEGAIRDCDWMEIPARVKDSHKEFVKTLQKQKSEKGR